VLERLRGIAADASLLDIDCGTGLVTERLLALVPEGRVLAIDQSPDMVARARARLGDRARVWCQDVLELELEEPVDAVLSKAALHWVPVHDRMWSRLASALRATGVLEVQCGGEGNIDRVREVIDAVTREQVPELIGFFPRVFAGPQETEQRLPQAGFTEIRCWLEERPTYREDAGAFVSTSILAAHLDLLPEERRERFTGAVVARILLPLDYVRLNVSAIRQPNPSRKPSAEAC
jgi:trans-aconitate 2-methyltransferase